MTDPHDDDGETIFTLVYPADPPDPPENLADLIDVETMTVTAAKGCVPFIQIERGNDDDTGVGEWPEGWDVEYV